MGARSFVLWIKKVNWKWVCVSCMLLLLSGSIVFGAITRSSYDKRSQDPGNYDSAPVAFIKDGAIYDREKITEPLVEAHFVLRVKPVRSEPVHRDRKVTLQVLEVYQGEGLKANDEIIFYEKNYFGFFNGDVFSYVNVTESNIMLAQEEYLLFADEKEYHPAYQKRLTVREFVPTALCLTPWFKIAPNQTTVFPADETNPLTYQQIKNDEFYCSTQQQLDVLNAVKESYFTKYKILVS